MTGDHAGFSAPESPRPGRLQVRKTIKVRGNKLVRFTKSDADFLERQRDSLRDRMVSSMLCDGARFAAAMEYVCRSAWQAWSGNNP
jgi:hypothetical protein